MTGNADKKGISGLGLLIPVFVILFALILIVSGMEWAIDTLSLMHNEKQVTQMDAELLSINDLYIKPSLKHAMQDMTRDLALHGGLSSEILDNREFFLEATANNANISNRNTQIEDDFNDGDLDFQGVDPLPMKVEDDILYWSYTIDENDNVKTIPYSYDGIPHTEVFIVYTIAPVSITLTPPYIVMITHIKGEVKQYDSAGNYMKKYTAPTVLSGDTEVTLWVEQAGHEASFAGWVNR